ncbi:FG-GAP repeat protein [Phormidium sp. FACHB-592]|uniref:FG-GAP-like repeat-containing protein n=1 Tax=Stenomitos frigidus AS-A4 TaxID=2933935 RepID=A0ABV0KRQ7_9CYAN|nr:FG-GAP-like repeat-containing protein [Phormidium sp. FACHB-592]MBD2075838.1 FG-GAP repeat protein [Phormidium sp. FACHB-592]
MDFSCNSNLQNLQSQLNINPSNLLVQPHELQDPLLALGSTSSQASASYTPPPLFGVRSETWQQGAGSFPGAARNGFIASTGQGVSVYQRGDEFGQTVETGDFNGDGYMDLAIGSPGEGASKYSDDSNKKYDDYRYNGPGMVSVMYGSATGLSTTGIQTFQASGSIAFGRSLAAGDFNNDGKIDLAVGSGSGVHILNGTSNGLLQPGLLSATGSYALEVGDFNGDGTDDLAAGNPFANSEKGSVTIFHGTANVGLTSTSQIWSQDSAGILGAAEAAPDRRFNSKDEWGDRFGFSLAAGDFDGNGKDDLAIGTPGERFRMGGISNVPGGAVSVLYGSQSGLTRVMNQFWDQNGTEGSQFNLEGGIEAGDQFGYDVAAGDFNGDGIADLVIGVPGEDWSTSVNVDDSNGGAVAIIYGKRFQGLTNAGNQLIDQNSPGMAGGVEKDDRFGEALAVGDINHDGRSDLMVGAPGETEGSRRGGAFSVIVGSDRGLAPTINTLIDQRHITGASLEDADLFGAALATGDFDGNGSDDLAIGAPGEKVGSSLFNHAGEVSVVYGDKLLPTITVSSSNGVISEVSPNSEQFVLTKPGFGSAMAITLKSVGTAKLGVDFTVSGASINGDFVTVQMPYGSLFAPETRTAFQVTSLQDSLREGDERIEFVVVKGDRYTVAPSNLAGLTLKDPIPTVVDTLVDENDGNFSPGDVSLRELIEGSIAGTTITFAPELQGTITLNSQLLINKNLTIDGTGADRIRISGNNTSRVFEIANGATVNLEGLTIRDGFANGYSGGGVENYGTLNVSNSRFTNNRAVYGGGIHNVGTLTLNNSTVDNNTAIYHGGGIYVDWGTVAISNSTFSGNTANQEGGGIYQGDGTLTVDHSTITNNIANWSGSGIYHYRMGGTTTIGNSIVAENRTLSNPIGDAYGSFVSRGYNLIGDTTGTSDFVQIGDRYGFYGNPLNPQLSALQNNGGTTPTHALLTGSAAIDAGNPTNQSSDQRGQLVSNGRRDIGAFEFTAPLSLMDSGLPFEELPLDFINLPIAVSEFDWLMYLDSIN